MSERQTTNTYEPPPAIRALSELTPLHSNPRRSAVDRGGVRQTPQDLDAQSRTLAGDPTAEMLYQTYRTPRPPHPHQSGPPQQSGFPPPTPPAVPVTPDNEYGDGNYPRSIHDNGDGNYPRSIQGEKSE